MPVTPPERLSTPEAAAYLGLKENTLERWRISGRHSLPFIKIGGRVMYDKSALDAWLQSRTATSTSGLNAALSPA